MEGCPQETCCGIQPALVLWCAFEPHGHLQEEEAPLWRKHRTLPIHPMLFFLSLNHTHTGFWVCDLKPSFLTLWGEVKHNHLKDDSEQEGRAEMDSEVLCCEPCSAPTFSSCQSHAGSLPAYPGHCLLKDEPGSGSFHGLLKLTGSSPEKQEMERCPWLLMRGELRIF